MREIILTITIKGDWNTSRKDNSLTSKETNKDIIAFMSNTKNADTLTTIEI